MKRSNRIIVGTVGLPGAGKTTAAKYLRKNGFLIITLSDFIKKDLQKSNVKKYTREILQQHGNRMRKKYGPSVLVERALDNIRKENSNKAVIDGIRNKLEVKYLQKECKFQFVAIKARPKVRYERLLLKRGKNFVGSYNNYLKQEQREESLGPTDIGLRVKDCLRIAKHSIDNNSNYEELKKKLDLFLKKIT